MKGKVIGILVETVIGIFVETVIGIHVGTVIRTYRIVLFKVLPI